MITTTSLGNLIIQQRQFFATGKTKNVEFRITQLKKLKQAIFDQQENIVKALKADLNKPEFESFLEIAVINEITYILKNIKTWVKPKKVKSTIEQFPSSAKIYPEPLGLILIIGTWNYPFSLMISPLIGAMAAGNCAILKPSELAPATSSIISYLIESIFDPAYITVIEGSVEISQQLLAEKFDHIFFTGSAKVGKVVMEAAAKQLTPVTLELGGKSPCIVDTDINLPETAKKIIWGKFLNAGQTCIAPDYLLVHHSIKLPLIKAIQEFIQQFYGDDPENSPDFARIINDRQYQRLTNLLTQGKIITGGKTNPESRYIAPTLIEPDSVEYSLMQEEIFGPILPILEYSDLEEAIAFVNSRPQPLALYLFSRDKAKQQRVLCATSSGGVGLNETVMHIGVIELPFGGVGASGMGSYHGKNSFDTFSHHKSVLTKSFLLNLDWRYAPYKRNLWLLKLLIR